MRKDWNTRKNLLRSNLPLRLQATMESDDPNLSLATVYDADSGAVGLYGVDDVLRPGVVVTGVDQGMLHLRNNAALEYLEIVDPATMQPVDTVAGAVRIAAAIWVGSTRLIDNLLA